MGTMETRGTPQVRQKRRRGGETRGLLLAACVDLLRSEGVGNLTTERVARAVGISQPGFYNHFRNIEALINEALMTLLDQMADKQVAEFRASMLGQDSAGPLGTEAMYATLDAMLQVFISEPHITELYLRYRQDPTQFGGAIVAIADGVRDEIIAETWAHAQRTGARPEDYPVYAMYAEQLQFLYYGAGAGIVSGRHSREHALDSLSQAAMALTQGLIHRVSARALVPAR